MIYDSAMLLERRYQPLISRREFAWRYLRWGVVGAAILIISLAYGICGYHFLEHISWIDSLLNASMILGGMGPIATLHTTAGKLFASFYALYSGLMLISLTGMMLTPMVHRFMHKFHIEEDKSDSAKRGKASRDSD